MLKLIQIDSNKLLLGNGDGTVAGAGAAPVSAIAAPSQTNYGQVQMFIQ